MVAALGVGASASAQDPVKLTVEPAALEVAVDAELPVRVGMRDARGRNADPPRAMGVQITARGAGLDRTDEVTLEPHDPTAMVTLRPRGEGILDIRARNPELRHGQAFVQVTAPPSAAAAEPPPVQERARRRPVPPPRTEAAREMNGVERPLAEDAEDEAADPDPVERQGRETGLRVTLRASPDQGLLANGHDASTVYAFLSESAGADGLRVDLLPDRGVLRPTTVEVPQGRHAGRAQLTASRPGEVRVELMGADPPVQVEGDDALQVRFEPPIAGMQVHLPDTARLGDEVPIVVRLVGDDGSCMDTDRPRTLSFARESGHGRLRRDRVPVPADECQAHTVLQTDAWNAGPVRISVASNGLLTQHRTIRVRWPWLLLAVLLVASAAGGFLGWTQGQGIRSHLGRRLFSGVVAGVVLYGLVRFVTPQDWVNNPFGVFLIAAVGGWLGTKAFEIAVRTLFGDRTGARP